MPCPWLYQREMIARAWGCKPWEVDAAPWGDVQISLDILGIEAANPLPQQTR